MTAQSSVVESSGTSRRTRRDLAWRTRPRGVIEPLAENLWWTWGSPASSVRPRSMVLARRRDGDLVVHDPLVLDDAEARALEAIGRPRYLLVMDAAGRLDARAFTERYPEIQVFAPRTARAAIARVVRVDGIFEDFPADEDVHVRPLQGTGDTRGVLDVRSADGVTLVLGDLLASFDRRRPLALLRTALRSPSELLSLRFGQRAAIARHLRRLAEDPDVVRLVEGPRVVGPLQVARTLAHTAALLGT